MMSDRLLAMLGERLGFVTTKWSIARIAVFAIAGLVIASLVLPARPGDTVASPYNSLATRNTRNVALALGDTRGFKPTSRPGMFEVAWIGGSETLAVGPRNPAFIPDLVARRVEVVAAVKGAGYRRVTLDLAGLRAGHLNDDR